jgi:UTP--glucose-1-phosphate uridylyltransferase
MAKEKSIYGLEMQGTRYDTGDKIGFLKATIDYALDRPDIGTEFLEFLKTRI